MSSLENPTADELREIAAKHRLTSMSDAQLKAMSGIINATLDSHRRLDELDDSQPTEIRSRDRGSEPAQKENPHNAWVWRSNIKEASEGVLNNKTLAIKDNVAVAGLPMRIGTNLLKDFVPDEDATMVTRVLAAGGTITGKAACEYMSFSGSSFTADTGHVLNPHDLARSAGGSSCGSAALVAAGAVDIGTGGDQSGSIRIPASFCGVYGLKPSYGLVPATGVAPIEVTVDHVGALAATVKDIAAFMDAVAGEDPMDPRQRVGWERVQRPSFAGALTGNIKGLKIGIVDEGFGWDHSEADVDSAVEEAAKTLAGLGAKVTRMSLPMHRDGMHINTAIQMEGAFTTMLRGNGAGSNWKGRYPRGLMEALGAAKKHRADELSDMMKELILLGDYLTDKYHGSYYAKAQNLSHKLTDAHNEALEQYDLLLMPSTPMKATVLPDDTMGQEETVGLLLNMVNNTSPTCVTGHPSISLPVAKSNGLPIGMMLTGRHWEDATVLRAADAFERTGIYGDVVAAAKQPVAV